MNEFDLENESARARFLRHRMSLDLLDYTRELLRLSALDFTHREIAKQLRTSQPSLNTVLKTSKDAPPLRPGFSGAAPYEVCQRFAIGEINREQLVDELTRWDYVKPPPQEHDFFDDLRFETPGSFDDVARAFDDGLIDGKTYDLVLDATAATTD